MGQYALSAAKSETNAQLVLKIQNCLTTSETLLASLIDDYANDLRPLLQEAQDRGLDKELSAYKSVTMAGEFIGSLLRAESTASSLHVRLYKQLQTLITDGVIAASSGGTRTSSVD